MRADSPPFLVVATAARALTQSAHKAGRRVVALDRFGDVDTRAAAVACRAIPADARGFDAETLLGAADALCPAGRCAGVVYGSGFECRPELLRALAAGRRLYGNSPETVERAKDPAAFFGLLRRLRIPHPEIAFAPPADRRGWLVKQAGGAGGEHVRPATRGASTERPVYYQRVCAGRGVSVLFLADGARCRIVGCSETWTCAHDSRAPYRYGGAVSDAEIPASVRERLYAAARMLTAALGLRGLNGLDALVQGDAFVVLEINPRPGATFELYEPKYGESFFELHLRASCGELPALTSVSALAHAHGVVYAPRALVVDADIAWPEGCSDLPLPGSAVAAAAPLCMVHAAGRTAAEARRLVLERRARVEALFAPPRARALRRASGGGGAR
ncbi:MAG TPA: ATP-grasp domain-containing protein [Burkholderiales bacterium]